MVDLKDFVRDSLVQLVSGLNEASVAIAEYGAVVNPKIFNRPKEGGATYTLKTKTGRESEAPIQSLEFDIAVVVTEKEGEKATIGVVAAIIGAGLASEANLAHQTTSRLKFSVPLGLAIGNAEQDDRRPFES